MLSWITFIIKKSLPVSYVENKDMREFAEEKSHVSSKALRGAILSLVEIVIGKITKEKS